MKYMINVDLEAKNDYGRETDGCPSARHQQLGWHYDLTVHSLECRCRRGGGAEPRPKRFWDHNNERGYTLQEVIERLRAIRATNPEAHPRRCSVCSVEANPPDWD